MAGGYDLSKFPKKYIIAFLILVTFASCFALFSFMYMNAGPHFIPDFFAIDNEQRVYLSFESGVYVVDGDRFYPVLSETTQSPTIYISDQDMLYVANVGVYTAIDLNTSVPKDGNIQSEIVSADAVRGMFDHDEDSYHKTDEQNGNHYRYDKGLFQYEIVQETNQGDRVLYQMPQSEYELNLFEWIGAVIIVLWAIVTFLISYSYAVKHPETITEYLLFQKKNR
ncbi:MAG: hypothetical protein VB091_08045 [Christensenella sp.]|nr:hypothetical protein [Christensenella sp.]